MTVGIDTVLDASALLALLRSEPGAARVAAVLGGAGISAVNLAEVFTKMVAHGRPHASTAAVITRLRLPVVLFDEIQAGRVADLRSSTRAAGLSLGDRACLTLALACDAPVLTTDRAWTELDIGVRVEVIR